MYTICLVEDEESLSNLIKTYLEKEGYEVIQFFNGKDAMNYIGNKANLWILDIMLSDDITGYDIIKEIRAKDTNIPVIFTSARDKDIDKIIGLEMGSDDYEKFLRIQQSWELIRDGQVTIVNGSYYSQKWGNIRKGYSTVGNKSKTYWHHDSLFTISKRSR